MGPGEILDINSALKFYGLLGFLGMLVLGGLWVLAWGRVKQIVIGHFEAIQFVQSEIKSLANAQRQIASDEHWKNCPIDKCPYLAQFMVRLNDIGQTTTDFAGEARESRQQTHDSISALFQRMDGLANEIIATLRAVRTFANGRNNNH